MSSGGACRFIVDVFGRQRSARLPLCRFSGLPLRASMMEGKLAGSAAAECFQLATSLLVDRYSCLQQFWSVLDSFG